MIKLTFFPLYIFFTVYPLGKIGKAKGLYEPRNREPDSDSLDPELEPRTTEGNNCRQRLKLVILSLRSISINEQLSHIPGNLVLPPWCPPHLQRCTQSKVFM